jgi:hypothetical protein
MSNSGLTIRDNLAWHGRRPGTKDRFKFHARKWAKACLHKLDRTTGIKALATEVAAMYAEVKANLPAYETWYDPVQEWEDYIEAHTAELDAFFEDEMEAYDEDTFERDFPIPMEFCYDNQTAKNKAGTHLAMQFMVSREDDGYEGYEAFGDA